MSVVFYFMDGCPACEATWPTWRKVKEVAEGDLKEVEQKNVPRGVDVTSFPTFVILDDDGHEVNRVEGRHTDSDDLMKALKLKPKAKKGKGRRRGTRKMTSRRRRARATRRNIR